MAPYLTGGLVALSGVLLYGALAPQAPPLTQRDVDQTVAEALASVTPPPAFSELVYQAVQPSLVLIETKGPPAQGKPDGEGGLGSGVVVNLDGDILTSLHVVDDATDDRAHVRRRDDVDAPRSSPRSPRTTSPSSARRGRRRARARGPRRPGAVRQGSEAYVVGNPFGLYGSMSVGVISGLDRSFKLPGTEQRPHRPHPDRRGGQPGQLRRSVAQTATAT